VGSGGSNHRLEYGFIDSTVVNVALPVLQAELKCGCSGSVDCRVALFLAALILVGGSQAITMGGGAFCLWYLTLCTGLSLVRSFANVNQQFRASRSGLGGALLTPGSLAIISASFSSEQRGQAIGTWSGFTGITSAGPVLGGWLVEQASWRWIFF